MRIEEPKTAIDRIILSRGHMRLIDTVAAIHNRSFSTQDRSSPLLHEQQPRQKRFEMRNTFAVRGKIPSAMLVAQSEKEMGHARGMNDDE